MITLVKKIKLDGSPCRKCADVIGRLESGGLMSRIDHVVVADERDAESEGMRLASELGVDAAPFFISVPTIVSAPMQLVANPRRERAPSVLQHGADRPGGLVDTRAPPVSWAKGPTPCAQPNVPGRQ